MWRKNLLALALTLSLTLPFAVSAQSGILPPASGGNTIEGTSTVVCQAPEGSGLSNASYCGNYTLNDFVALAINVAQWILGIVGSLTLAMLIYGGFMLLISSGSAETVTKAKNIIVAAVIGLIIVFASYLIIKFVLDSLGVNWTVVNGVQWNPKGATLK